MSEWISVKDRLPKESTRKNLLMYIISSNIDKVVFVSFFIKGEWVLGKNNAFKNITHWMPLPKPPKL